MADVAKVTGQIDGRPFVGVSAVMRTNPADGIPTSKIINVYEKVYEPDDFPFDGDRYLDIAITLSDDDARAEGHHLQFTILRDGGEMASVYGETGAVEVVSMSPLRIKLNVRGDDRNHLSGEIDVVDSEA